MALLDTRSQRCLTEPLHLASAGVQKCMCRVLPPDRVNTHSLKAEAQPLQLCAALEGLSALPHLAELPLLPLKVSLLRGCFGGFLAGFNSQFFLLTFSIAASCRD